MKKTTLFICAMLILFSVKGQIDQKTNDQTRTLPFWTINFNNLMEFPEGWQNIDHSGSEIRWELNGIRAQVYNYYEGSEPTVWSTLVSEPIDCSDQSGVILEVNHQIFYDVDFNTYHAKIEVSNDNTNWHPVANYEGFVEFEPVFGNNMPLHEYDISSVADNQAQVWVRFEFKGNSDLFVQWDISRIALSAAQQQLEPAVLVHPANEAVNQPLDVTLEWAQGSELAPDGYRLYLDTSNPPSQMVFEGNATSFTANGLSTETTYYWMVVPYSGDQQTTTNQVWTFTTMNDGSGISLLPHYENFDQVTTPDLPLGWNKTVNSTSIFAEIRSYFFEEDPIEQPVFSEPNHLRMSNSSHIEAGLFLVTPPVLHDLSQLRVRFYAKSVGVNGNHATNNIEVGTMSDPSNQDSFVSYGAVTITEHYDQYMVSLENHTGTVNQIAFRAVMANTTQFTYIDDVVIENIPSEPELVTVPSNVDFGQLENNYQTLSQTISIRNWGGGVLVLNPEDIYIEGAGSDAYVLESIDTTVEIEAFESVELNLIFAPQTPGIKDIVIHIADHQVPVTGNSIHPNIVSLPYFEDFNQTSEPELPLGWRNIVIAEEGNGNVRTILYTGNLPSAPNVLQMKNEDDGEAELFLISPLVEPMDGVNEVWVRFYAKPNYIHDYLLVGTMTDREDPTSFEMVEKVWLYSSQGQFWEYGVRIPVGDEPVYVAFKADFYRRQRALFIDDIALQHAPALVPVNFVVEENSASGDPVADAGLKVLGHSPITTREILSGANGQTDLQLEPGFYSVFTSKNGYDTNEMIFEVQGESAEIEIKMDHTIYPPVNPVVSTEELDHGNALFSWNDPGDVFEFRYDDGSVDSSLGFHGDWQQELRTLGSAHHYFAELHEISWFLTPDLGPHDTIQLWITALDEYGYPDVNQVLYWNDKVPNIDDQWNTYQLPEPLLTPNGFFVGLGYEGFLSLATDKGTTHPYQFIPERHFAIGCMHSPSDIAMPIEGFGYQVNLLLRAHGYKIEELEFEDYPGGPRSTDNLQLAMVQSGQVRQAGEPKTSKSYFDQQLTYHLFLDEMDSPFIQWHNENEYMFTDLEPGTYNAGVQTAFSTGVSEIVQVSFVIEDDQTDISEISQDEIKIFPNPTRQNLNVLSGSMISDIRIYNITGQLVHSDIVNAQQANINLGHLKEGIYLVLVFTTEGPLTQRIQITR